MPTLQSALDKAAEKLSAVSDSPKLDAQILLCHALNLDHAGLIVRLNDETEIPDSFQSMLERRTCSEPVAYILGEWEFYSIPLAIRPPTLVPRPETEHLVEAALDLLPIPEARILDMGTGSGCIPIAIALNAPYCSILATDIKPDNLALASENAVRHNLQDRITFAQGSLFDPVKDPAQLFHIICSNPPYVSVLDRSILSRDIIDFEDPDALYAGDDGLDLIREIIAGAQMHLHPGGSIVLETGLHQHTAVTALLDEHGYNDISYRKDLAGIERIAIGKKPQ